MSATHKEIIEQVNAAFAEGSAEGFLSFCAEDVTWTMVGNNSPSLPSCSIGYGREPGGPLHGQHYRPNASILYSRSLNFWTLPLEVMGYSFTNRT